MRPAIWLLLFLSTVAGAKVNAQCLLLPATSTVAVPVVSDDLRLVSLGAATVSVAQASPWAAPLVVVSAPPANLSSLAVAPSATFAVPGTQAVTQAPRRFVTLSLTSLMTPVVVTEQPLPTVPLQAAAATNEQVRVTANRQSLTRSLDSFAARLEVIRQRMNLPPVQNQNRLRSSRLNSASQVPSASSRADRISGLLDSVVD